MEKKVYMRISADFVLSEEQQENQGSKYAFLKDKKGNYLLDSKCYFIGYEDENGNECDEDGEEL